MCVGAISSADQINTILAAGRADLVALGRGHLADPFLTLKAAAWYGVDLPGSPPQYELGLRAERATARRAREELLDLRQRAKPKGGAAAAAKS